MSILNHPIPSKGQPLVPARASATQDARQHLPMSPFNPSIALISDIGANKIEVFQNGSLNMPDMGFAPPVAQSFLCSLSGNQQLVRIDDRAPSRPTIVLSVSVSSAVRLDARQIELIGRKMRKLTGFRDVRLINVVDPSLIAGFTICYGDDESSTIDLSVKGQLAALAARVESSEQSMAHNA